MQHQPEQPPEGSSEPGPTDSHDEDAPGEAGPDIDRDVALAESRAGPQSEHGEPSEGRERRERDRPRIYAASLSDYNAGELHGAWVDANQDPDDLGADIDAMLAASPTGGAEEWAIHDYDGFGPMRLSEYETIDTISRLAAGIGEHGAAFAGWAANVGTDPDELDRFDDAYLGHYGSVADYAEELLDDLGVDVDNLGPEWLSSYIHLDVDAFARDLSYDLYVADDPHGGVHLYHP